MYVTTNRNFAAEIVTHISSTLRDPDVNFINKTYLVVTNWHM